MVNKFTKWKVLSPFLNDYRRSMILSDFERELDKPHQTLKKYIEDLVEDGIFREEKRKKHSTYRLNLENPYIFDYLSVSEKLRTGEFLGENLLIKRLYEKVHPFFLEASFLIFGSYAVGRGGNDIDLLILGELDRRLKEVLKEFGKTYKDVHKVHVERKEDLDRSFVKELLKKHVIFNDSDRFVRIFGDIYGETGLV